MLHVTVLHVAHMLYRTLYGTYYCMHTVPHTCITNELFSNISKVQNTSLHFVLLKKIIRVTMFFQCTVYIVSKFF